ncbi:MAG: IS3 family transposase [bacterium]|nr:IS3 family transposase [bacterium]
MVERNNLDITISRQAELLDISRSSLYYQPVPMSQENIDLMNNIDKIYTKCPFYGARQIKRVLKREHKIIVSRPHVRRLMGLMGIEAIYPKPNLSKPNIQNQTYPYLLRNLTIDHPNQVWGTDITYVKLNHGFCYLVAIMDWYSRYVVAWELSSSLDIEFVISNLKKALVINIPEIENSDQGSHFTSIQYTNILIENNVQISMDGRGRCMDNIFTERLWRNVKYENIYIKSYNTAEEARTGLTEYFEIYNNERPHSRLNELTPAEVYFNKNINKLSLSFTNQVSG